jgi:hypothetical protein
MSREEDVIAIFEKLSAAATKEMYVELATLNKLINMGADRFKDDKDKNKFKGDMFEVFAEIYFSLVSSKITSGVVNYEPLHGSTISDYGVDGTGLNYSNKPCVVQVKYRSNVKDEITYTDLSKTWHQAEEDGLVNESRKDWRRSLILFTNCNGANKNAVERNKKYDRLYVINNSIIESEINGNVIFWKKAYDLVKASI